MSEQIENNKLVPVKDLLNKKFLIPSYQRGYRWTCRQVNDLLDDILEFSKNNEDSYYCLQPLIVKEVKNGEYKDFWEVIDGQQRLTTIHIILSFFKEILPICIDLEKFGIRYETREQQGRNSSDFLKNLNRELDFEAKNNIDFLHMSNAYKTIKEWCGKHEFNVDDLLNNVKFIWYDVNKDHKEEDSHEVFARFNMGKIQLTNAELIKALFLQQKNFGDHAETIRRKQLEIAMEWDTIELALQDDDFWYFLNTEKCKTPTRIEFIFDLIRNSDENEVKNQKKNKHIKSDKFYTFFYFQERFKKDPIEVLWGCIKNKYMIFKEWFEDDKLYQLIGFMIAAKTHKTHDLIKLNSNNKSKVLFEKNLKKEIKKILWNSNSDLSFIDKLKYYDEGNKKSIENILLWFNVTYTSLQYKDNKIYRFPFGYYNRVRESTDWSLEHIHAQKSEHLKKLEQWRIWFSDHLLFLEKDTTNSNEVIIAEIKTEIKNIDDARKDKDIQEEIDYQSETMKRFLGIYAQVFSLFGVESDGIGNLALLDGRSNTALSNSIFAVKRQKIIEMDLNKNNVFIPPCTRHVFLKYFTNYPSQFYFWSKYDADSYLKAIKKTLEESLLIEEGENK